jgi:hypothetical protein
VVDSDVEEATEAEVVAVPAEEDARMRRRSGLYSSILYLRSAI